MDSDLSFSSHEDLSRNEIAQSHPTIEEASTCKNKLASKKRSTTKDIPSSKKKSWVWEHYTKVEHPLVEIIDGEERLVGHTTRAQCRYCPKHLSADSGNNGTSTLAKHLEQHCPNYPGRANLVKGQTVVANDGIDGEAVVRHWSKEACTDAATVMIVMDEQPFSVIERPGFKYFCSVVVPKWKIPCRKVIVKNFLKMYADKKEELKRELGNHCLCLTTDTWTSVQNIKYMVLTAHFIDNGWAMHKRILNFCVIPNHQGQTIGKILECCLKQWNIEKVLTISVDNSSANKVAIDYIKRKMMHWDTPPLLGGRFLHVKCLAHILNIIVKSGLTLLDKSVAAIRNAVRYVRSSPQRIDLFKAFVQRAKLDSKKICVLDVPTRWNSTYIMLDTALELQKAFDMMARDDECKYTDYFDEDEADEDELGEEGDVVELQRHPKVPRKRVGPPRQADWDNAEVFVKFLRVFYETTLRVSATNSPSSPTAFSDIVGIHVEIEELFAKSHGSDGSEADKVLVLMSQRMRVKYRKYFKNIGDINQLFLVAVVLDPRYKMKYLEHVLKTMMHFEPREVKHKGDEVRELLVTLCDLYATSFGFSSSQKSSNSFEVTSGSSTNNRTKYTSKQVFGKVADMLADWDKVLEDGDSVVVGNEVDRYLLDPIEKPPKENRTEFKLLLWWKLNGAKYPNLAMVAKDILAVQVSTVASESSFSTGKRVIDPHRSSLTPKSVEALICLQNWLLSGSITSLAYVPTPEEMAWMEEVEAEQEREEQEKAEKERETASSSKTMNISKETAAVGDTPRPSKRFAKETPFGVRGKSSK